MKAFWITITVLAAAGAYVFYQQTPTNIDQPAEITNHSEKKPLYICPMHPQIHADHEGATCPICGMDLVLADQTEMEESGLQGRAEVNMSGARKQLLGVKLQEVTTKALFKTISVPGRAAFDPELYTAQAEYQQALKQLNRVKDSSLESVKQNVRRMIQSSRVRLKVLGLSDSEIRAIPPAGDISDSLLVYRKGGNVWIYADVFEMDLPGIRKGQSAKITAGYLGGTTLTGVVTSIDQVVDPKTRAAKVRIKIKNAPVAIRAESYVNVAIYVPMGEHLAVPLDAIVDTGRETYIFVKTDGEALEPRAVSVLFRAGDMVAIGHGLDEGDEIVTSGNFLVDSESRLRGVLQQTNSHDHNPM